MIKYFTTGEIFQNDLDAISIIFAKKLEDQSAKKYLIRIKFKHYKNRLKIYLFKLYCL